jgi:hypothetical protein
MPTTPTMTTWEPRAMLMIGMGPMTPTALVDRTGKVIGAATLIRALTYSKVRWNLSSGSTVTVQTQWPSPRTGDMPEPPWPGQGNPMP